MPLRYPCEVSGGTTWVVVSFRIVTQLSSLGNSSGLIRQKTWTGSLSLDVVNTGFDRAGVLGGLVGTLGGIFDLLWKKKVIPQSKLNKTGCQPVKHNSLTSRKMWIFNKKKKLTMVSSCKIPGAVLWTVLVSIISNIGRMKFWTSRKSLWLKRPLLELRLSTFQIRLDKWFKQ